MTEPEEMVTITKNEYQSLLDDERWRTAMENAGVDNWGGYDYAMRGLRYDDEDIDD